jgi:hypothetical protein
MDFVAWYSVCERESQETFLFLSFFDERLVRELTGRTFLVGLPTPVVIIDFLHVVGITVLPEMSWRLE